MLAPSLFAQKTTDAKALHRTSGPKRAPWRNECYGSGAADDDGDSHGILPETGLGLRM
jgi:hypothetical protein